MFKMENSSTCDCSDDDGSVIICIDTDDTDDFEEQNDNEQEMEITSSDVIIRNMEGSIQNKICTQPDSSDKMSINPSNLQAKNIEVMQEDKVEVTSSDTNTTLLLEKKDVLYTNPDSSNKKGNIIITSNEEGKVQMLEDRSVEKDKLHSNSDSSNKYQNIYLTTSDEEEKMQKLEKKRVEKDALQTQPVSSTTVEQINIEKSNEDEEVKIIEEKKVKKEESLHIPTKILQSLIAKAIISSPKGFLAVKDIEKYLIQRVPCSGKKTKFMMKLILSTLESNSDVFMSLIVNNEDVLESGLWTLHPLAAANFAYYDTLEKSAFKKQKYCHIQKKHSTIGDDEFKKEPVVAIKRSSTLDYWASKRKVAKMEAFTMIMPSSDVITKLMNYGISFETKWGGWNSLDIVQENKISELENILKSSDNSVNSGSSKIREKEQLTQDKSTPTLNSTPKSLIKVKGIKRVRLSDSCSDLDSSDNEIPANGSIVHKEHNYVASEDSSGSKNLIESLRKIVQKMDKDCDNKSVNNKTDWKGNPPGRESLDEEEDFLGFDYDLQSGYWRGWEKASSRNAERMKEIARSHEGSRDLEEVLRESDLAVTRCIEELDRCNPHNEANVHNPTTCDLDATIQKYLKELMTLFDHMAEEPPISYLVLTVMAVCASPESAASVIEICHFIQQHFPFHCHGGLLYLEPLVEMLLRLGSPSTFSCQKSRRPSNPATCWKVDSTSACGILARALESVKVRSQPTRSPLKETTEKDRMNTLDLLGRNRSESQQGVIVHANVLESPNKTCHKKHEIPINVHRMGEKNCISSKENMLKHFEITADLSNNSQIPTQTSTEKNAGKKTMKDLNKSVVVSAEPVIFSVESHSESTKLKQNVTPPRIVKLIESVTPGKINGLKSPCNYPPIFKEDQELEIVDIDPCLQDKENSNLTSEDDEIIVIDEDTEQVHSSSNQGYDRLFGSEQSSTTNEGANEVGERTSNCLFLLRCHNLDSENKQYPCYICHKFYGSNEVLNIHFAQTHFEKENVHVTSALCQSRKRKTKSIKGTKNVVIIPSENSFKPEVIGSRSSMENILLDLQSKRSDGVIRYNCSKCNAIFHEKETLNLHITLFHEDEVMRSLIPLKQVSTPEGNRFYYCDQCSGCFHTEKALLVHKCAPFSRARSSST